MSALGLLEERPTIKSSDVLSVCYVMSPSNLGLDKAHKIWPHCIKNTTRD